MPTTLPGISVTKAAELLQTQDRIIRVVSGSRLGLRQGRARGDRDRSGAVGDVRDHRQSQAEGGMASGRDHRQPDRRDGQGAAVSRRLQRLDHADQGPHRHAVDRHPHAGRRQGDRHRSGRDRQARQADRAGAEGRARHLVGLRRARHRRLLSRSDAGPRGAGALRHHGSGRAGRHRHRARRPDRDHHGGRPAALHRQHALSARPARQSAGHRQRRAGADAGRRRRAARRGRQRSRRRAGRPRSAPRTGSSRPTSMSTSATAISAATSPTRSSAVQASIQFPPGYLRDVERPVRISRARRPRG